MFLHHPAGSYSPAPRNSPTCCTVFVNRSRSMSTSSSASVRCRTRSCGTFFSSSSPKSKLLVRHWLQLLSVDCLRAVDVLPQAGALASLLISFTPGSRPQLNSFLRHQLLHLKDLCPVALASQFASTIFPCVLEAADLIFHDQFRQCRSPNVTRSVFPKPSCC